MKSYNERIDSMRATKLAQTREKQRVNGYMDHDDHGIVLPPSEFRWTPMPNHECGDFFGYGGWGRNFRSLLEAHPIYVNPVDALAGRFMVYLNRYKKRGWRPEQGFPHLHELQKRYDIVHGIGAPQHFAPDYRIGLDLGWAGILDKVRINRRHLGPEKAAFFQAEEDCVLGIQSLIRRTAAALREAEPREADPELRDNLRELATANEWLVENPPRTLREACQWMAWTTMACRIFNGSGAGGQIDVLLQPYYERDKAAGLIDDETAIYYLAGLLLSDAQYHQLGGPGPDGTDVCNSLSFLVLEAAHRLKVAVNLTVRVHDGMNREFFLKSVQHLVEDRQGWPRYCGDMGLVQGFMRNGYSAELARQRIAVGCHWMAIPGREYTLNDCVKINCVKVFEVALHELFSKPDTEQSMQTLWDGFSEHLKIAVRCTAEGLDFHHAHQWENNPELALNLLCHGTLEQGLDASNGGVEYYNMCVDGSGLATVADSFAALEQRIEHEQALTWAQVQETLATDFAGVAGERTRLMLGGSQRYGQGGSRGDEWAMRVSQELARLVKADPTPGGLNMIPGWFSWSNTIGMGRVVGATPNGRKAGAPISHGANPDPGFRRDAAPTAMSEAISRIQPGYGNTAPIQLEFDPGTARGDEGINKIANLIETHFKRGGTLFNINIVDAAKLLAAHHDPSLYPDLVVRVTGFTAFFASLSPKFRQLVIDRLIAESA